jgi:hypothetical protein
MRIYSGTCCMCDVGIPTGEFDMKGRELFTGDIVQLWHGDYIGTDFEEWMPSDGLTAIVSNQYQSYTDGTVVLIDSEAKPFTMGIFSIGVSGEDWRVSLVKSHTDIVVGERFAAYGFNYRDE